MNQLCLLKNAQVVRSIELPTAVVLLVLFLNEFCLYEHNMLASE